MTNGNSDRKRLVKILAIIIILIIASVLGINVSDFFPSDSEQGQTSTSILEWLKDDTEIGDQELVEGALTVHMIDVGQGDGFLLVQDGRTALVDCGTASAGKDIVKYLKDLGISNIDYVFGTHPHDDHMGGMYEVITNFDIGKVIIPEINNVEVTSNWYLKLMKELKDGGYHVEHPKLGTVYNLGGASIKVIGPIQEPTSNKNDYSIVLKVSFGEMDMIMTGDAEKTVEQDILAAGEDIEAEILKVGHHGSDTSTSEEFLDAISPDFALISAEVGNKYKHPIISVMEELKERNILVYRTDESGTIIVTITAESISFSCKPGDYLSGTQVKERK
ncbi:MAG: MBL fold metallo-hydrolase [Clostridia bacterium]|nr:MBL fold metallo-hydrolase [Clostridia bacterium]